MAVNVSAESIASAVVSRIATVIAPSTTPLTATTPIRQVERYIGAELADTEAFRRGIAGRCPAARVRYVGTRTVRTTMGRRVQRVESTFEVVLIDNSHEERDRRQRLIAAGERVRHVVTSRQSSLAMEPLRYRDTKVTRDDLEALVHVLTFTAKHRTDYTIDPGLDTMLDANGSIVAGDLSWQPTATAVGAGGTTKYVYKVVPIDATGARMLMSVGAIVLGAATLTGANYNSVSWPSVDLATTYELYRVESNGTPSSEGLIATTSALSFNDTGIAATTATPTAPFTQDIEVTF